MALISMKGLSVRYDQVVALKNVTFDIEPGEFIGIIGPNGGGKTTLVKTILQLLAPSEGTVEMAKNAVVGYVPQYSTFDKKFPISVMEVILTGHLPRRLKLAHRFKGHDEDHAIKVMKRLGIEDLAHRQIGQLSGGQMQRVLIARALMNHPNVLILDEPTASVDEQTKQAIYELLRELNKDITILIITHDTNQIWQYLDRCIYINQTAHFHDSEGSSAEGAMRTCPIDWFVEGEKIQKELMKSKGGPS